MTSMLSRGVTMYGLTPPESCIDSFSRSELDRKSKRSELLTGAVLWLDSTA